jgi:N4-gp56 family major capsid protein
MTPPGIGYDSGTIYSGTLPAAQRVYYEAVLRDVLRTKSLMVPFCTVKEDFRARDTGMITYSEVFDTEPNWNPLTEQDIWLSGAHLDTRSLTIGLEIHGDTLKFSDYAEVTQYLNRGDLRGLVRDKIGQNQVDTLDILARNAFLTHPNKQFAGGTRANRAAIQATDLFDPDLAELARTHLEEAEVPGVVAVEDGDVQTIVCVTTPRVVHDIRTAAGSSWLEVNQYAGSTRKFTGEAGTWNGVRFVRTNRLILRNHGAVAQQTTLAAPTVPGQGAAATVDMIYSVGQSTSTRYVPVASAAGFAVGDIVTIHSALASGAGNAPLESDGTQETRRIVAIDGVNISFDKPLLKMHAPGDLLTKGVNIHSSIFMGGPAVVYAVGERSTPVLPPKYDDMMMINRIGWRGFFKFQMFRPEFIEVHETSGSTN